MLPTWPGASEVYSRAYARWSTWHHGHVRVGRYGPVGRGLTGKVSWAAAARLRTDGRTDRSPRFGRRGTIKAVMWETRVYGDVPRKGTKHVCNLVNSGK